MKSDEMRIRKALERAGDKPDYAAIAKQVNSKPGRVASVARRAMPRPSRSITQANRRGRKSEKKAASDTPKPEKKHAKLQDQIQGMEPDARRAAD